MEPSSAQIDRPLAPSRRGNPGGAGRALQVDVFAYFGYRAFLRDAYVDLKQRQAGFSYRWFARRAGMTSPNFLKLVIDGKRNLSAASTERFATALELSSNETAFFRELVGFGQARTAAEKNRHFERIGAYRQHRAVCALERHQFEYLSHWWYPAIRELVACEGFVEDADWIASRLVPAITPAQARQALDLLHALGFVDRDERGRLRQRTPLLSTGPEVRSLAVGNFHRQMMERAAASIDLVDRDLRDISGVTIALSPEAFQRVKQKIVELRAELLAVSAGDDRPTRVVQVNFQLFPLADTDGKVP
ncbi:MAG TPA: TIGR02147 family protein [Kofleriaceae bacterium]